MNPSVKNQRFLPAPFGKGAFGVHRPKPPLPKGGGLAKPNRGDKRPSGFHMGWYFGKAPTVNPSVKNQRFLPAPFHKGAFGVQRRSPPLPKGGGLAKPNRGDKRPSGFHMGSYFGKVPPVESLSHGCAVPAPTGREPLGCTDQSPPGHCGGASAPPRRGDSAGKATDFFPIPYSLFPKKPFHIGFLGMISASCRIPQSRLRRASSLSQGSLWGA